MLVEKASDSPYIYMYFFFGHLVLNATDVSVICPDIEIHGYSVIKHKFGNIFHEFNLSALKNTIVRRTFPSEHGSMFYTHNHEGLKLGVSDVLKRFNIAPELSEEIMNYILYDFGMDGYAYI